MSDVFYAYTEGRGEGCDYTIGCNLCVERLKATTMEAAIAEAVGDTWSAHDDERVKRVTVLRVTEEVDCGDRIAALRAERVAKEQGDALALKARATGAPEAGTGRSVMRSPDFYEHGHHDSRDAIRAEAEELEKMGRPMSARRATEILADLAMNCATCRHWGDEVVDDIADGLADDEDASAEQREAAQRALADPLHKCARVPFYYDPSALASTASVRDGSGYRGVLLTRSGFGCVLHEVKR